VTPAIAIFAPGEHCSAVRLRTLAFLLAALAGAALFARLGVWQLSRLHERQGLNDTIRARLAAPPMSIDSLVGPPDSLRYRRARVAGRVDYAGEALLVQRTRDGSPGVYLLTPVHTPGSDSATLVVRGWVYAPDGTTIDRPFWREADSLTVEGYLDEFPWIGGPDTIAGHPDALRRLDRATLARRAGTPLRSMYLWATGPEPMHNGVDAPARFTLPVLDDGPHRSYAVQWFSFATIALVGAGIVVRNDRRTGREGERAAGAPVTRS
jgi:surfeit locus 1 family protein